MLSHTKKILKSYNNFISKNQWFTFIGLYVGGIVGVFALWSIAKFVAYAIATVVNII